MRSPILYEFSTALNSYIAADFVGHENVSNCTGFATMYLLLNPGRPRVSRTPTSSYVETSSASRSANRVGPDASGLTRMLAEQRAGPKRDQDSARGTRMKSA